jgi:ligand-binding sensor domain-containing protein
MISQRHRSQFLLLALVGALLWNVPFFACAEPSPGIPPHPIIQIYSSPSGAVVVLTEEKGGLFLSSPTGGSWRQGADLPDTSLYSITADTEGHLLLTTAAGVFRSSDEGATWRPSARSHVAFVQLSPRGSIYLAKIWGRGLFIGEAAHVDLHESAMKRITALPSAPVQCVAFGGPHQIFAGFFGQGVYVSNTGGRYWEQENTGLSDRKVLTLDTSPTGAVFAGTYGGGLAVWSRKHESWAKVDTGLKGGIIQCMAFGPEGSIFAGSWHQGGVVSRDNGLSWQRLTDLPTGADIRALAVGLNGRVYAGTQQGLWVSNDRGNTWKMVALQP